MPDDAAREELLRGLEALSGRRIRTRQDVEAFMREHANPPADRAVRRWQQAKSAALLVTLGAAGIQYYLLDVWLQIVSMPQLVVFVGSARTLL